MQTLHKEQKIAISVGVTAILAAIGIVAALMSVSSGIDSPKLEVPIHGNNMPEMIVIPDEAN
ncbi:hypothetical protein [Candidatus Nitrosotenuis cloacae]|uniref:hypothetical protein n=1 Tax=Candidatus Nitrosotenuis cloacae TaxID=1603555 RepID=UPI00227EF159|nr:hypothetical protein [Candidatus Nitrosotenuis cloacae]